MDGGEGENEKYMLMIYFAGDLECFIDVADVFCSC